MPLRNNTRIPSCLLFCEPLEGTKLVQRLRGHSFICLVLPFKTKFYVHVLLLARERVITCRVRAFTLFLEIRRVSQMNNPDTDL